MAVSRVGLWKRPSPQAKAWIVAFCSREQKTHSHRILSFLIILLLLAEISQQLLSDDSVSLPERVIYRCHQQGSHPEVATCNNDEPFHVALLPGAPVVRAPVLQPLKNTEYLPVRGLQLHHRALGRVLQKG